MKKLLFFLCVLNIFVCSIFCGNFVLEKGGQSLRFAAAESETTTYAKASAGCTLYKSSTMEKTYSNIYFVVPETYFMSILEMVSDDIMKVNYNGYVGYVYSDTVVVATFIPILKSLVGITFDIKETSGTQVWGLPTTDSQVLTTIPAGTTTITYIAFAYGDIPSGGESNIWYYVTYTPKTNSTSVYEGYVYSENTTGLGEIVANTETNPEVIEETIDNDTFNISPTIKTLLIALISIPIIIFFAIILLKIVKMMRNLISKRVKIAENQNLNNFQNQEYIERENGDSDIKSKIANLKNNSFVRKRTEKSKYGDYPVFPTYDSDDDLL